jgi:hypothetical protein
VKKYKHLNKYEGFKMSKDESWLNEWAVKYKTPVETLKAKFEAALATVQQQFQDLTDAEVEKMARTMVKGEFRRKALSGAGGYQGVVFGVSASVPTNKKRYEESVKAFKQNRVKAIADGIVFGEGEEFPVGTPRDNRPTFASGKPNSGFNKPLDLNRYLLNIVGVASHTPLKEGDPFELQPFIMTVGDVKADPNNKEFYIGGKVPTFQATEFSANQPDVDGDNQKHELHLNISKLTEFVKWDSKKILPPMSKMLSTIMKDHFIIMSDLPTWHAQHAEDKSRFIMFNCTALSVDPTPTQYGSWTLYLDDESLEKTGMDPLRCYVPLTIDPHAFGNGSRLLVIGATKTNEKSVKKELQFNIWGIYIYPKFKTQGPATAPVTKADTEVKPPAQPAPASIPSPAPAISVAPPITPPAAAAAADPPDEEEEEEPEEEEAPAPQPTPPPPPKGKGKEKEKKEKSTKKKPAPVQAPPAPEDEEGEEDELNFNEKDFREVE